MSDQKKKLLLIPILLTAIGGPYAVFSDHAKQLVSSIGAAATSDPASPYPSLGDFHAPLQATGYVGADGVLHAAPFTPAGGITPRLEGPPVQDLAEVIRFDISPRWVAQYWSRVTTVTSELELEGLRVPLVTGGRPDDLAGSLTYYFDKHHQVQRVTFHGSTGDERRLVTLLGTVYGFKEQPALGGGMYVTTWNGKPTSVLRVAYAPIVQATTPHAQREITLEINRPGEFSRLSEEMKQLITRDAQIRRW
jgi:hypothetical protein